MRILGIDPGTAIVGISIIEYENKKITKRKQEKMKRRKKKAECHRWKKVGKHNKIYVKNKINNKNNIDNSRQAWYIIQAVAWDKTGKCLRAHGNAKK